MAVPYVSFPGVSGNYITTADINLMDCDTSHIVQSQPWEIGGGTIVDSGISGDWGYVTFDVADGAASSSLRRDGLAQTITDGDYTYSVDITNHQATSRSIRLEINTTVQAAVNSTQTIQPGTSRLYFTASLLAADITAFRVQARTGSGLTTGDQFTITQPMLARNGVTAFDPSIRIVGNLDLRAKVSLPNYVDGAQTILTTWNNAGFNWSVFTAGQLRGSYRTGTNSRSVSSAAPGFVNGEVYEVRATFDVATGEWAFYKDDVLISDHTVATGAGSFSDRELRVGRGSSADYITGNVYWAEVRDGIDGPVVGRFDAEDVPT